MLFSQSRKNGLWSIALGFYLWLNPWCLHLVYADEQFKESDYIAIRIHNSENLAKTLEQYKDKKVKIDFDSDLVVTQPFAFDFVTRSDKMVLSWQRPLIISTQLFKYPSVQEAGYRAQNHSNKLYIETQEKTRNKGIPYYPAFEPYTHYMRVGDRVSGLFGTLKHDGFVYRLILDNHVVLSARNFLHVKDRQSPPVKQHESHVRIVSFNLQNYFVSATPINGDLNPQCITREDANTARGCNRGAKNEKEFLLQQRKLIAALMALDADLIGVTELENNGFGDKSAISFLIKALNENILDIQNKYQFIEVPATELYLRKYLGDGPITVGILYRPSKVELIGDAVVLEMPVQIAEPWEDGKYYYASQRDSLAQTFRIGNTAFNFIVSHFKSKRPNCIEDNEDPYGTKTIGGCNNLRVASAQVLGDFVARQSHPTLLVGDLNAYAQEDPIRLLTSSRTAPDLEVITAESMQLSGKKVLSAQKITSGFNLVNFMDPSVDLSYNYSGQLGTLDYILGSQTLAHHAVKSYVWNINSHESSKFSYIEKFSQGIPKSIDAVRSSDHDPLVVDFDFSR